MDINENIFELFDYIDEYSELEGSDLAKHLDYVNTKWDALPDSKLEDPDRTLLALLVIDLFIKLKDFENAEKWIKVYLHDEVYPEQISFYNGMLIVQEGENQ